SATCGWARARSGTRRWGSLPERLSEQFRRLAPGKLLLPGDQVPVADGEPSPQPRLDVVGAELLQLVLDPPGHDVLVPGEGLHLPGGVARKVLLDVGEPGDRLPPDQELTVGQSGVAEERRSVAERAGELPRLVELHELLLQRLRLLEGEHRRL